MRKIDEIEADLAEYLRNFDPVRTLYGLIIAVIMAVIFLAPWLKD